MNKILIVGLSHNIGGIETLFKGLFGKKSKAFDLTFLYFSYPGAYAEEFEQLGYRIKYMPSRKSNPLLFNKRVKDFFKEYDNYDYVWVNTSSTSMYQFQYYAKKYTKAKVITHSHGTRFDATSGKVLYVLNKILDYINKKKVVDNTDLFFCCSYAAGEALFGKENRNQLILIKNGISKERFAFSNDKRMQFREKLQVSETTTVITFVGRLSEQKNPIRAIDIFKEYHAVNSDSILLVVGDGNLKNEVEKRIMESDLKDCVILLGFYQEIENVYFGSDALLMPSLFEGLPLGGVEAQMSGLNCFFSDSITKEIGITELAHFISLDSTNGEWAQTIIDMNRDMKNNRRKYKDEVSKCGYDYDMSRETIEKILV